MKIAPVALTIANLAVLANGVVIPPTRYKCVNELCVPQPHGSTEGAGFSVCRTACGKFGTLWPKPTGQCWIGADMVPFNTEIKFTSSLATSPLMDKMHKRFSELFTRKGAMVSSAGKDVRLNVQLDEDTTQLTLDTDESYTLKVLVEDDGAVKIAIKSKSIFGYNHALTTLSQLIVQDEITGKPFIVQSAMVTDKPAFPYRGLLLDTSRNFYPIEYLKKLITSMGINKLNTFHWHFSDTASFSIEFLKNPEITEYGVFSPQQVYTQADILSLVEHGKVHGVRVLPELDAPAHMGQGWQWGKEKNLNDLILCFNAQPWKEFCIEPPCGQINPLNDNTYRVLSDVYDELTGLFDSDIFHMGGDELHVGCWNSSSVITDYLDANKLPKSDKFSFFHLWGQFQVKARELLRKAQSKQNKKARPMIWHSDLTNEAQLQSKYLDPYEYIIQIWSYVKDNHANYFTNLGYDVVLSYADNLYLDCGYGGWLDKSNGWCGPVKSWQHIYDLEMYYGVSRDEQKRRIKGAEAPLWSEMADPAGVEQRIWPKGAALAERLWSNPPTGWADADDRMQYHRYRMVRQGFNAEAIQPLWCLLNQGQCKL